ncbi:MAG: hemerythrin domain-containing protein [Magnetococcales bacterium]|nr:hemerythrin domain-containing protein [Magnetococcales bacterium]
MLAAFQEKVWGDFHWFPVLNGPERWGVTLERAQGGDKGPGSSIVAFFSFDHRRCDQLFAEMEQAARSGALIGTRQAFERFELGMLHHFKMEEEGFFPRFEEATGMGNQGPTQVMRMEHVQMRGVMSQMRGDLDKEDLDGVSRACGTLLMLMQQHNVKEEQMLYPMSDMHLDGAAKAQILRESQRM